jgi:DNA-directed RNA polymerase subunit K/omega
MSGTVPALSNGGRVADLGPSPLQNRFHVAALAFQRARQLQAGARPRVARGGHNHLRLALLEVMADTLSWSVVEPTPR